MKTAAAVAVALAMVVAACGSDDSGGAAPPGTVPSTENPGGDDPSTTSPGSGADTTVTTTAPDAEGTAVLTDADREVLEDVLLSVQDLPEGWRSTEWENNDDADPYDNDACRFYLELRERAVSQERIQLRFESAQGDAIEVQGAVVVPELAEDYFDALVDPTVLGCLAAGAEGAIRVAALTDGFDIDDLSVDAGEAAIGDRYDALDDAVGFQAVIEVTVNQFPVEFVFDARAMRQGRYVVLTSSESEFGQVFEFPDLAAEMAQRLAQVDTTGG